MALFMACMARMYSSFASLASPGVTEKDHAKKRPAMRPVVVAVAIKIIDFIVSFLKKDKRDINNKTEQIRQGWICSVFTVVAG